MCRTYYTGAGPAGPDLRACQSVEDVHKVCRIVRKLDVEARENILTEGAATDKQLMLLSGELEEFSRGVLVRVIRGFAGLGDLGSVEARALPTARLACGRSRRC